MTRNANVVGAWISKIFRIEMPGPEGYLDPRPLLDRAVGETGLPQALRDGLVAATNELRSLGFTHAGYFLLTADLFGDDYALSVLRHEAGDAAASIVAIRSTATHPATESCMTHLLSSEAGGTIIQSSNYSKTLRTPRGIHRRARHKASAARLWRFHQQRIAKLPGGVERIDSGGAAIALVERQEGLEFDDQVARKIAVRIPDEEIDAIRAKLSPPVAPEESVVAARPVGTIDDPSDGAVAAAIDEAGVEVAPIGGPPTEVAPLVTTPTEGDSVEAGRTADDIQILREVEKIDQQTTTRRAVFMTLLISGLLFVSAGAAWWSWRMTAILVPVLLFHELGHYVAMRVMKYRNLKMFFIPLMGAAVSGRKFNVPGWKQVIVSLAGPVPGIVLGGAVGLVGLILTKEWLLEVSFWLMLLNAFNLLPFLPLDGGWVLHAVVFCRHVFLDVAFRSVAAAILFLGYLYLQSWVLFGLAMLVGMGIPAAMKIDRVARRMIERGVPRGSPDDQHIPEETAIAIGRELRAAWGNKKIPAKSLAGFVPQVFERMNARPPAAAASIGLLALHGGSFVGAIFIASVYFFVGYGQNGPFWNPAGPFAFRQPEPTNTVAYDCGEADAATGYTDIDGPLQNWHTIVANFDSTEAAKGALQQVSAELPERAAVRRFGNVVMLRITKDDAAARKVWVDRLATTANDVFVESDLYSAIFFFRFNAPSAELAERLESELDIYLNCYGNCRAPWHPERPVTEPGTGPLFLARRTLRLLIEARFKGSDSHFEGIAAAYRTGDEQEIERLRRENRKRAVERVREQGVELDPEVVRLFEVAGRPAQTTEDTPEAIELSKRLGYEVLAADDAAGPLARHYAAYGGDAERESSTLKLRSLQFEHCFDGLGAFSRWLCDLGCTDIEFALANNK